MISRDFWIHSPFFPIIINYSQIWWMVFKLAIWHVNCIIIQNMLVSLFFRQSCEDKYCIYIVFYIYYTYTNIYSWTSCSWRDTVGDAVLLTKLMTMSNYISRCPITPSTSLLPFQCPVSPKGIGRLTVMSRHFAVLAHTSSPWHRVKRSHKKNIVNCISAQCRSK